MKTLADAWDWYQATTRTLKRMQRLGGKHWADPSLVGTSIWLDERLSKVEASAIVQELETSLNPIDDLAVVVLFSLFESQVRDYLVEQMKPEADGLTDPILKEAAGKAIQGVKEGTFYRRVLDPLKKQDRVSSDLVTQVDQVRDYRNWVAHGRRDAPTNNVTPLAAYNRLSEFLAVLSIAIIPEYPSPEQPDESPE